MNMKNLVNLTGRVARDPHTIENKDGSRTVFMTLAVEREYKSKDGTRPVDFVAVQKYVPAGTDYKAFDYVNQGDLIQVGAHVESADYEKDGNKVYEQKLVVDQINFLQRKRAATSAE